MPYPNFQLGTAASDVLDMTASALDTINGIFSGTVDERFDCMFHMIIFDVS